MYLEEASFKSIFSNTEAFLHQKDREEKVFIDLELNQEYSLFIDSKEAEILAFSSKGEIMALVEDLLGDLCYIIRLPKNFREALDN